MRSSRGPSPIDPRCILTSLAGVVFDWRMDTDRLSLGANARDVLRLARGHVPRTGAGLARLTGPEATQARLEALAGAGMADHGAGCAYRIHYALAPAGRDDGLKLWMEESGHCFTGPDGLPQRTHGIMRVVDLRTTSEAAEPRSIDDLTGQLSRQRLVHGLDETIGRLARSRHSAAFLLAGIDNLAAINRSHGSAVADAVIAAVARRLRTHMRLGDALGRLSGNRLGLILERCGAAELPLAAQRCLDAVAGEPVATIAGPIRARLSIGGVLVPRQAGTAAEAIELAGRALAQGKAIRRGGFTLSSPGAVRREMRARANDLTDDVVAALNERRVLLALEPIAQATAGTIGFQQGRVTLRRRDGRLLAADAVGPVSETAGLSRLIDYRGLELAFDALAGAPRCRLMLGLPAAGMDDEEWLAGLTAMLRRFPVAARLTMEIREEAAGRDRRAALRFARTVKDFGVRICLGGFGGGRASASSLRALAADMVRIDGAFVQNLARSADDRFFVRALIDLALQLGVEPMAEWVQDEDTARRLTEWGCIYLQGRFIGNAQLHEPAGVAATMRRAVAAGQA